MNNNFKIISSFFYRSTNTKLKELEGVLKTVFSADGKMPIMIFCNYINAVVEFFEKLSVKAKVKSKAFDLGKITEEDFADRNWKPAQDEEFILIIKNFNTQNCTDKIYEISRGLSDMKGSHLWKDFNPKKHLIV